MNLTRMQSIQLSLHRSDPLGLQLTFPERASGCVIGMPLHVATADQFHSDGGLLAGHNAPLLGLLRHVLYLMLGKSKLTFNLNSI
jgi:hypothetical protein